MLPNTTMEFSNIPGKRLRFQFWFVCLLSAILICLSNLPTMVAPVRALSVQSEPATSGIRGGYWLSWLAQNFTPSAISTSHFTHLFYAFLEPNNITFQLTITPNDDQWMRNFTATIHANDPRIVTVLSIGGGGSSSPTFSAMVTNQATRSAFINSAIKVARAYGFDGLDLDWEFPKTVDDMSNLSLLFKEWRQAIEIESFYNGGNGKSRLILSAAVSYASNFSLPDTPRSYPSDSIKEYVDFVSPMCFDYHGGWNPNNTGEHALLLDKTSNFSTSYGITSWINAGVPPEKLVMGLPIYGRSWQLKNGCENGIGAPAVGVGPGDQGVMTYSAILDFNHANAATVVFDSETVSTYSFAGTIWIGYDGPSSIQEKVKYAKAHGLGGYFIWALGYEKDWALAKAAQNAWSYG